MKHQEGNFKGIRGGNIYHQCWLPEKKPKAVLLIVHGLAEHSGRYSNVVNYFVPLGYAVYGMDLPGHGRSDGRRVHVKRFEDYTDQLKAYFDMVRVWQSDTPIFLTGHSMGGLIAGRYLLDHQEELAGAILSAPSVKVPDTVSPATIAVGRVLSVLVPTMGLLQLEAEGICRDPAVVEAYVTDSLVHTGKVTARLSAELLKAMQLVSDQAAAIELPILLVQGTADRLVDPDGARMLYERAASTDKTIKTYDGLYHEVFNEPEHDRVLKDVETWLETHLGN